MSHSDDLCSHLPRSLASPTPLCFISLCSSPSPCFPHSPLDSLECCENKPINALSISEKKSKTNVVLAQPERSTRKNTNTCDAQSTHWGLPSSDRNSPPPHPRRFHPFISQRERERERSLRRALSLWIEEIGHVESITGALIHCFNAYSCANVDFCGYNATLMRRAVFTQTGYLHECLRGRGIVAGWCIVWIGWEIFTTLESTSVFRIVLVPAAFK